MSADVIDLDLDDHRAAKASGGWGVWANVHCTACGSRPVIVAPLSTPWPRECPCGAMALVLDDPPGDP